MCLQSIEALNERIGEEVCHLRIDADLSLAELGAKIGVSYHQMQRYESGQSPLTVERLVRIATVLRVDPAHFLGRDVRSRAVLQPGQASVSMDLLPRADLDLAAKIARIRDDAARRDIIASIDRLADMLIQAENRCDPRMA